MTGWQPEVRRLGTRDDHLDAFHAAVKELIEPRVTLAATHVWVNRNKKPVTHKVTHASLLDELDAAKHPANAPKSADKSRTVPGPRSPAHDAAIDRLRAIEIAVTEWTTRLRLPLRMTTDANLRQLRGHANMLEDDLLGWLALDTQRWATWARVATGWQSPPYRPHVPCPHCERTGTLLIRGDTQGHPADAYCTCCGADWRTSDGTIGLLAEYIRGLTKGESA